MTGADSFYDSLFGGLRELAESAFPKKCAACGRIYSTAEEFLAETEDIRETVSGLKQGRDDEGAAIVEAFRNCPCGSTLMDFFNDRRDISNDGNRRRAKFGELLDFLVANGLQPETARSELLKVMKGDKSDVLSNIRPPGTDD